MSTEILRLIAWNCHHGTLNQRVRLLQSREPALLFLQECNPGAALPLYGDFLTFQVNAKKGIALGSLSADYRLTPLERRADCGQAVLAADVQGPVPFTLLGIW